MAALALGCGGGDGSAAGESAAGSDPVPEVTEPVAELLPALARAGRGDDCAAALELIHRVQLPEPDQGKSPANCESALRQLRFLRGFEPVDSVERGTGAVVDGDLDGEPIALAMALDQGGEFKWIGLTLSSHQVGSEPDEGLDYERGARAFVDAVRDGDCKAAHAAVAPGSRLAYDSRKDFCDRFEANFMAAAGGLGARLRADPDAQPADLGGTAGLHYYGLATEPDGYRTIVVSPSADQVNVFDVVPAER